MAALLPIRTHRNKHFKVEIWLLAVFYWSHCVNCFPLQVEVLYGDEPLKDYYTLMDIAYFYEWRRVSDSFYTFYCGPEILTQSCIVICLCCYIEMG